MIGVDCEFQGRGYGESLLQWAIGKGRWLSEQVAFRFMLADVNLRRKDWYDARGWVVNRSGMYNVDDPANTTISMRLDLRESPAPADLID